MVKIFRDLDFHPTYIRYDLTKVRSQFSVKKKETFCTQTLIVTALAPSLSKRADEQNSRMCYIFRGGTIFQKHFSSQSHTATERYIFSLHKTSEKRKYIDEKETKNPMFFMPCDHHLQTRRAQCECVLFDPRIRVYVAVCLLLIVSI